jgi:hypothetical protein
VFCNRVENFVLVWLVCVFGIESGVLGVYFGACFLCVLCGVVR